MAEERARALLADPALFYQAAKVVFDTADTNYSGYIERSELKALLVTIMKDLEFDPATDEEVDQIMRISDTDADGRLSFEEFLPFTEHYLKLFTQNRFQRILNCPIQLRKTEKRFFDETDANGNGQIEKSELKALMTRLADEQHIPPPTDFYVGKSLKMLDTDGDGTLSFEEFSVFVEDYLEEQARKA